MENLVFTQLSVPEIKQIFRHELEQFFATKEKLTTMSSDIEEPILAPEAAKFLGISIQTLYDKRSRRELPSVRRGKRLYFFRSDLIQYLKEGCQITNQEINKKANDYLESQKSK